MSDLIIVLVVTAFLLYLAWSLLALAWNKIFGESKRLKAHNKQLQKAIGALITSVDGVTSGASISTLDAAEHEYRLVGDEKLMAIQNNATRREMKSTGQYSTSGSSFSIPIVKGIRYRFGMGNITRKQEFMATAKGRLLITDKAVVFESEEKNERYTWGQISDMGFASNGFVIQKRKGASHTYLVESFNYEFAAIADVWLRRV